jgi:hypothetical protein
VRQADLDPLPGVYLCSSRQGGWLQRS